MYHDTTACRPDMNPVAPEGGLVAPERNPLRCEKCRWTPEGKSWTSPPEDLLRQHVETIHPEPAGEERVLHDVRVPELRTRQNVFLDQLQALEPDREIEVQHFERDAWHGRSACISRGCASRPLWTRGILRSEVVYDFDEPTYRENYRYARVISGALREAGVPQYTYSTGSKGFHVVLYVKLSPGANDETAKEIREATWKHFLEVAALDGVVKVDAGKVRWSSRSMLHAWGDTRKAPYTFMERPLSRQPRTLTMPPQPMSWDPKAIPSVREVLERPEGEHVHRRRSGVDAELVLAVKGLDPRDFDHYPFVRDFMEPEKDHDGGLVSGALLLKSWGLTEDETAAFFGLYWRPKGSCSSASHRDPFAIENRVRNIYRSKWFFDPKKGYRQLKEWGREPDRVLWTFLFRRMPLETAHGERRRAEGCGDVRFVPCPSCGKDNPIEDRCRATAVCPDCFQHQYVASVIRYRASFDLRFKLGATAYVAEIPATAGETSAAGVFTSYTDAFEFEHATRKEIECDADVEFLRVITPEKIVYVAFAPFTVAGKTAAPVRTFSTVLRHVVPTRSPTLIYASTPDPAQAWGDWVQSSFRRHDFQTFGWHKRKEGEDAARTFAAAKPEPACCAYCGAPLNIAYAFGDWTASTARPKAEVWLQAGLGPPP